MPISPTRGELRFGADHPAAATLDEYDRAKRELQRHFSKFACAAAPAKAAHYRSAEEKAEHDRLIAQRDAALRAHKEAEANPPTTDENGDDE